MAKVTERKLVSFDWAVKKLLKSKANFGVLEGFLSELLFDDIKILEILESESNKDDENDKFNRVDIKVKNAKGELIIIEVQFNDEYDFFHRLLYATSKTICEHLDRGKPYSEVVKVISINILYFDLGEGNDYIYKGKTVFNSFHDKGTLKLNDEQRRTFKKEYPSDIFPEYYIIKVNNFNDVAKSTLDEWIYLFKNSAIKSDFKAKGIKKAGKVLDEMKMSKEERAAYDRFIDNKRIALGQLKTAIMKERRKQEAKIKQLENKHSKELQEKENKYKEELQEKENKHKEELQKKENKHKEELQEKEKELQAMAKLLLENGLSKEQICAKTGIKL